MKCVAGCMSFAGGERKHHRDCPHYPESLTKIWHDSETEYLEIITHLKLRLRHIMYDIEAGDISSAYAIAKNAFPPKEPKAQ